MKPRGRRDQYHHGALRQALIDAASSEIERVGLENLSLRSIAEQLGVSKTAPFRHFSSKQALLTALAAEGFRALADTLERVETRSADGAPGTPRAERNKGSASGGAGEKARQRAPNGGGDVAPSGQEGSADRLLALGVAYVGFARERPALYRLMFSRLGYSLESESCKINAGRAFGVLVRTVQGRVAAGWKEAEDPEGLTVSMWALVHGWAGLLIDELVPKEVPDIEERWTQMLAALLR